MRVTQAFSPTLLQSTPRRLPVLAAAVFALALGSGCATKTTLGEKSTEVKDAGTTLDASKGAQTTTITQLQRFMWFFSPYRPDIQQGNFVSEEMLAQLKVGMTRTRCASSSAALLEDPFHGNRWDYAFRLAKGNGEHHQPRDRVLRQGRPRGSAGKAATADGKRIHRPHCRPGAANQG
jgi:outer membrane protein assembly factor BamE